MPPRPPAQWGEGLSILLVAEAVVGSVAPPLAVAQLVGVVRRVQATRGDSLLH